MISICRCPIARTRGRRVGWNLRRHGSGNRVVAMVSFRVPGCRRARLATSTFRVEGGDLGPLCSPVDNDTTETERVGVLSRVMLDHSFKPVSFGVAFTGIAEKQFLSVYLSEGLDLAIKNPLHVLKSQLLGERSLWRVWCK